MDTGVKTTEEQIIIKTFMPSRLNLMESCHWINQFKSGGGVWHKQAIVISSLVNNYLLPLPPLQGTASPDNFQGPITH